MDKSLKNFINTLSILLSVFVLMVIGFAYFYQYSTINTYNRILIALITITILTAVLFIMSGITIFFSYKNKKVAAPFQWMVNIGLKFLLPLIVIVSGLVKSNKDVIRKFYIDVNNILVESGGKKYFSEDVLVVLPHCLQFSSCTYKITTDIKNCVGCGRCCVGDIYRLAEKLNVEVVVVTGGTAARNIVTKNRPKIILSVACERDLTSGIADVSGIPVIGIINDRPNGPCVNTTVDMNALEDKLKFILK